MSNVTVPTELQRDREHLLHPLHDAATADEAHVWVSGQGSVLIDETGREILDGLAGLWNVLVGHGRTELAEAAAAQMSRLAYCSSYAGSTNRPAIALGERLAELCYPSIKHFFFTSGGAESNESAFKTARYFWKLQGFSNKTHIIGRQWGYHGTTLAAMSATGISSYWPMFEPRTPGFSHIASPYPYRFEMSAAARAAGRTPGEAAADLLEVEIDRLGEDNVAAFLGEPVQGAGGVIVPPDDYWPRIREICDRRNILLIADEVITGFGRLGDWFAFTRYGIEPDIVSFAKGITSGYFPLGGIGVNHAIAELINAGAGGRTWMHAFTYSAHPVACAVALANLDILVREGLLERAKVLGDRLLRGLQTLSTLPHVGDVRGMGLMTAVELVEDKATKAEFAPARQMGIKVHRETRRRGLFTRLRGDIYNLAPALVTEEAQIDQMVEILGTSIETVCRAEV